MFSRIAQLWLQPKIKVCTTVESSNKIASTTTEDCNGGPHDRLAGRGRKSVRCQDTINGCNTGDSTTKREQLAAFKHSTINL